MMRSYLFVVNIEEALKKRENVCKNVAVVKLISFY